MTGPNGTRPKKNYYAVAIGRKNGIFTQWSLCRDQVDKYDSNCYEGFETLPECISFLMDNGSFSSADDIVVYHNRNTMTLSDFEESLRDNSTTVPDQLTSLAQLETCDDQCLAYIQSLDVIYAYNVDDIQDTLNKLPMDTLKALHKTLWDRVRSTFDVLQHSKLILRQVKHTIVPDIYQFGLSLVNKLLTKELDKAYNTP